MDYTLKKGKNSNYEITLTVTEDELKDSRKKALQSFQKEVKHDGFREGKVPLDIVEKKVQPQYVEVATYEQAIHGGTKKMLEENKEIKFIGNIYDLNREEKDKKYIFTYKIDVYPEVKIKNDTWKKLTVEKIDSKPSDAEIQETLNNLSRQYASYDTAEKITENAVFKVQFKHLDSKGNEVDTGSAFIGKEEFAEFPKLKEIFLGKKANDTIKQDYTEDGISPVFHNRKDEKVAKTVFELGDIKTVTYPEFTPENIKKFFGNDDVKTKEELIEKVTQLIAKQKEESLLIKAVDDMIEKASKILEVDMPKTLIDEEIKSRMESLKQKMGGEDGLKEYFDKIGDEKKKSMLNEIQTAAQTSLGKFFRLRKLTELLGLEKDIDWKQPLDVERTVYKHLSK